MLLNTCKQSEDPVLCKHTASEVGKDGMLPRMLHRIVNISKESCSRMFASILENLNASSAI